jgi:uncharacterized membrane protein
VTFVVSYIAAAIAMAGLDIGWLRLTTARLYHPALGGVLAENVNTSAAISFYLVYIAGIVWFGVVPALKSGSVLTALLHGALFGFFAYATYDLTNLATLKVWSLRVSLIDMAWGTTVTGLSAAFAFTALGVLRIR